MSGTLTFPPGLEVGCSRETVVDVKIDRAESGFEVRTRWNATPRYKFKFKVTARKNVGGTDEADGLYAFYNSNYGEFDSFAMVDPVDGTSRSCRFSGPIKMVRAMPTSAHGAWWEMEFEVQSLADPS